MEGNYAQMIIKPSEEQIQKVEWIFCQAIINFYLLIFNNGMLKMNSFLDQEILHLPLTKKIFSLPQNFSALYLVLIY